MERMVFFMPTDSAQEMYEGNFEGKNGQRITTHRYIYNNLCA
jgi:hypothetical protein